MTGLSEMNIRKIRKIHKIEQPKNFVFFDTESYLEPEENRENHTLKLGVCIFVKLNDDCQEIMREVYYFRTANEFWDYIEKRCIYPGNITWIIAHNIKYDLANVDVIEHLPKRGWELPYPVIKNAFIMSAKKGRKQLKIIDTFNFYRGKVSSLGDKLGIPKMSINFETCTDQELFTYCENDVMIIEKFVISFIKFLNDNNLGSFKTTLASTAMNVFRHSFMNIPIYTHTSNDLLKDERLAYKGGRVECFYIGKLPKQNYYLVDINSMYPFMMREKMLPVEYDFTLHNPSISVLQEVMKTHYVIGELRIDNENKYGVYGIKHEGKLIFPTGEFNAFLQHPEIEYAERNGHIRHIYTIHTYHQDKALSDYANYFYEMKRKAKNPVDREIAKILCNSLYGKFGMRKYITETTQWYGDNEKKTGTYHSVIDGKVITYHIWFGQLVHSYSVDDQHVTNTNIALAGAITAYARMYLLEMIENAGLDHVYYCDTDSLLVDKAGYDRLLSYIHEDELGKLKLEGEFNNAIIYAPKNYKMYRTPTIHKFNTLHGKRSFSPIKNRLYIHNKKTRSKGIPLTAVENDDGSYDFWRFTTFLDYLKSEDGFRGRIRVVKNNRLEYDKGNVDLDTGKVTPYRMKICQQNNQNQIVKMTKTKITKVRKNRKISLALVG